MRTTGKLDRLYRNYKSLEHINRRVRKDLEGFILETEEDYKNDIDYTAEYIASKINDARVVMLSGPSGSGKTTSAEKLSDALEKIGIKAHMLSMDNYFLSRCDVIEGVDFESPLRLDIPLLQNHIEALSTNATIEVPEYDFLTGLRKKETKALRINTDEVVIFEGIHALNCMFIEKVCHRPIGIYVSPRMRVTNGGSIIIQPESIRFLRRSLRDKRTRGASFERTLGLWESVIKGELEHIMPNKWRADIVIDTTMEYELGVYVPLIDEEFSNLLVSGEYMGYRHNMENLTCEIKRFEPISRNNVPEESLLREFIGK